MKKTISSPKLRKMVVFFEVKTTGLPTDCLLSNLRLSNRGRPIVVDEKARFYACFCGCRTDRDVLPEQKPSPWKPGMPADDGSIGLPFLDSHKPRTGRKIPYGEQNSKPRVNRTRSLWNFDLSRTGRNTFFPFRWRTL